MPDKVSLKEYVLGLLAERDRATTAAVLSMDKRLDSMNEFRSQLRDQAAKFVDRAEHDGLATRMNNMEQRQAATNARLGIAVAAASVIGAVLSIAASALLRH